MDKSSSRCICTGRGRANAAEIPLRNPPYVRIAIEFFSKAFLNDSESMGMDTEIHRQIVRLVILVVSLSGHLPWVC